jgi:hypothetical protein
MRIVLSFTLSLGVIATAVAAMKRGLTKADAVATLSSTHIDSPVDTRRAIMDKKRKEHKQVLATEKSIYNIKRFGGTSQLSAARQEEKWSFYSSARISLRDSLSRNHTE